MYKGELMMNAQLETYIHDILVDTVTRTIQRMKQEDTHRPFHQALLSDEIIKASRFERSFSTSFGQKAVEKISNNRHEVCYILHGLPLHNCL